ncbi:MAG: glycosyltransferase family 2 protein [Lachnospiraceae bacterium]|nr:glycosyltransferase family 2 protein [Lachnospiraceae bacterium]
MDKTKHTFVICAYKESPYLEKCILSLKKQTVSSKIIMVTSTPNAFISRIADKYDIPLIVNEGEGGITQDWNFGYTQADTPYITIAHQDDIYKKNYTEHVLKAFINSKRPLIFFSDYAELRNEKIVKRNQLLQVKRLMLLPMCLPGAKHSVFIRRRILSFGSPICCPSVAYAKENLPNPVFENGFRSNEDWEAWERLSRLKGDFLFDSDILVYHRIHEDSETSAIIKDNQRSDEDMIMYSKFWPRPIAALLTKLYAKGQDSNEMID